MKEFPNCLWGRLFITTVLTLIKLLYILAFWQNRTQECTSEKHQNNHNLAAGMLSILTSHHKESESFLVFIEIWWPWNEAVWSTISLRYLTSEIWLTYFREFVLFKWLVNEISRIHYVIYTVSSQVLKKVTLKTDKKSSCNFIPPFKV